MGKNKMIAISNSWRIGCQGFWVKYYPKRSEVWRFYSKPVGLDLYSRERGLLQAKIIFAIVFYFFIAIPFVLLNESFIFYFCKMKEKYSLYKYFKGDKESPYDAENEDAKSLFWFIESIHFNHSQHDNDFNKRMIESLDDYIQRNRNEKNALTDESIPKENRALILYIDLMIGKWRPYDGDLIFEY